MTVETNNNKMTVLMILCLDESDDNRVAALESVSAKIGSEAYDSLPFTFGRRV